MIKIIQIIIFTIVTGQEINWIDNPIPITAFEIFCDTDGIPIFVDGIQIGVSPIEEAIQVSPGWHQVSYFPPQLSVETESIRQNRIMRDMIKLARQDILVEDGKTVSAEDLERINKLGIPPAYQNVWISTKSDAHLQATGKDDRNRTQYRYHSKHIMEQDHKKYFRCGG